MKYIIALCMLFSAVVYSNSSYARIIRVAYSGPKITGVDFNDVGTAIQAAVSNDTIQLYQNASVGSSVVNKRLVFIGFGYSLETNPGLQAVPSVSNQVSLYFNAGSENSVVQGVYGNFYLAVNNVSIIRCLGTLGLGYNAQNGQYVAISDCKVLSSYLNITGAYGSVTNALISNCILSNMNCPNVSGLVSNNISAASTNAFGSCVVKNNIFTYQFSCPSGNAAVFEKNLVRASCNLTGSGNLYNVDLNSVFVNWNNGNFGSESNLALKAGSPAIGFGIDGNGSATDAGIFGGEAAFIYKLSGIPAIPSIYQLTAPQINASTNPYTITISVRSNN